MSADGTPFVAAPIQVGESPFISGDDGRFIAQVAPNQDASISSGLRAIKVDAINGEEREELPGTGAEIASIAAANGGVIEISVSRRIKNEPVCLAYSAESGREVLWFRYTNRFGETLEVTDPSLNSILSPSGFPYPISRFDSIDASKPDGHFGFEWALDYFLDIEPTTNRAIIRAVWKLLGKEVTLEQPKEEIPLCAESGETGECSALSRESDSRIFKAATETVNRIAKECEKARKLGAWRPQGGFRTMYYKRAGSALKSIRKLLSSLDGERLVCPAAIPARCSEQVFPKAELLMHFDSILRFKLPKGLQHVAKQYPSERRKFIAQLNKHPDRYVTCRR